MNHRELKDGELIERGDEYLSKGNWFKFSEYPVINIFGLNHYEAGRRPIPEPATFDEASNFDPPIHVSHEEVIYPKADEFGDKEKAIASALELFKGMDRVIPPTPNQLGVLYDAGKLNITK